MKSNYKQLGRYIRLVDVRNRDLAVSRLLGVGIAKEFMPSIANTVGTDMSNYKVVRKGQFAYGPVTSRNGDKISVALLREPECIISQAYTAFEIINTEELDPEYLMLWFSRPEFDRYARYHSHGSVREIFSWDDMCRVELPVPDIGKQKKIIKRISQIRGRLEALEAYDVILKKVGICIVASVTGGMSIIADKVEICRAICERRGQTIKHFCSKITSGATPLRSDEEFWTNGTIPWLKSGEVENGICNDAAEKITELGLEKSSLCLLPEDSVLLAMYGGGTVGEIGYLASPSTTNQAVCGMVCKTIDEAAYLFFSLLQSQEGIRRQAHGGAQENLNKEFIENLVIINPIANDISKLKLSCLIKQLKINMKERQLLCLLCKDIIGSIHQKE